MVDMTSDQEAASPDAQPRYESGVDQSNLNQALIDFEVANSRVIDLTLRLTTVTAELLASRESSEAIRFQAARAEAEAADLRAQLETVKSSLAYRTYRTLGDTRARLRR
jgi:hypothetical protein